MHVGQSRCLFLYFCVDYLQWITSVFGPAIGFIHNHMMEKSRAFSFGDIQNLEPRFRTTFINSLGGFKSLALIGTRNKKGETNLAIFNSIVHLGASPPLIGFIVRPDSVDRHTLSNILETGELTINHVQEDFYERAHQTSARYPEGVSEFTETGLTEEFLFGMYAPFVKESVVQIGAAFRQRIDISENGTVMIVAKIKHVVIPEGILQKDGYLDLHKAGTITCSGLDSYYRTEPIARLAYAKPTMMAEKNHS